MVSPNRLRESEGETSMLAVRAQLKRAPVVTSGVHTSVECHSPAIYATVQCS